MRLLGGGAGGIRYQSWWNDADITVLVPEIDLLVRVGGRDSASSTASRHHPPVHVLCLPGTVNLKDRETEFGSKRMESEFTKFHQPFLWV